MHLENKTNKVKLTETPVIGLVMTFGDDFYGEPGLKKTGFNINRPVVLTYLQGIMDLEDPSRMEYEIVVPVKPLPSSDKPLKGLLKRNKCESNSSSSEDKKSKKRVKFAETMMVFCDDWPEEIMPQIIALKSPTDFNLIEIVASGFMFEPPVEYQDLLPFDPPPDYQDCVSSNKQPSIIPMSSYEKDSSIGYIDEDIDQYESNEFANDYHNQLNSALHWENILNESEILEEDIIGVLKEDEILQAIGSQTADIDTVFHPLESEDENYNEADFPIHYHNGQYHHQHVPNHSNNGVSSSDGSNSTSDEGHHAVDGYCDKISQSTETSETFSETEELSSDLASDSSFTSQDTIILTTPLSNDPNAVCRNDFLSSSSSSADNLLSPGKTVVAYVDHYSTEYSQIGVNLEFEPKPVKPILETINDEEEEVRSDADIGSISEDRSSLNESVLEDVNKVNNDNYSKDSRLSDVGDGSASLEVDDANTETDGSLGSTEVKNNYEVLESEIKKDGEQEKESKESSEINGVYTCLPAVVNEPTISKVNNSNNDHSNNLDNNAVNKSNEPSGINENFSKPLVNVTRTTDPKLDCPEALFKTMSLSKPVSVTPSSSPTSSTSSSCATNMSPSSASSVFVPTATFLPAQTAVVNACGSNLVVIGLVDCDGVNKSQHNSQQLLTTVPMNTSVSVSAIRKAFESKQEIEAPIYENTTEMRNKVKNASQPVPQRPKSFPFSNFKLGKSMEPSKNSSSVNSTTANNGNSNNSGNNNSLANSGSSLIKEATNVMTEKLKRLKLHGDSSKQLSTDESGKAQQAQSQRRKEDLIIEYTSEPRGAQQVKRVSLPETSLKNVATFKDSKGVITLQGTPLLPGSAQIVNHHYHHVHHQHGQSTAPTHQLHSYSHQQPLTVPVSHFQCFPPGTTIPISSMGASQATHQIVQNPNSTAQQQQVQPQKLSSTPVTSSSTQFIAPSTPQPQLSPNQPQSQPQQQPQQYHIYPVTKCRAASPQFINQYYATTASGQRQLVYVSHVSPGQHQPFIQSQTIHHHHHPHAHHYVHQQTQAQTGQPQHGQPSQPGMITMVSGTPQASRDSPSPSIIQLHCRPATSLSNQQIVGPRIYAQPLQHGFVAIPKDSSFPNPSEIRRRDGLNAYPVVKEDPLKVVNTQPAGSTGGNTNSGNSPSASSLSSTLSSASSSSSSSSSSVSPSSTTLTSSTVPNTINSSKNSDSSNLSSSDTKDELEQFVENDIQRIERIKRRYSLTEEGDDPTFGFGRRPSVRGIKPKFGPNEIIRHMQMQLRPPIQSISSQTLPKQAKVINTQIVNESPNPVSSTYSPGLTASLSTSTITTTTTTPVVLATSSISSQPSSQVPRTAQIHLIARHSHPHCHPHLISANQIGSVPNLRQQLVSSSASVSPSSTSSSPSPSIAGHNTLGHRHVYLIPHIQGGPQYQRIVQAGATLPRQHPMQQKVGQAASQSQLSPQQAAMLMMKGMGGRVKIINGSQSASSIGFVSNQPPLSRPASSLGHIIQRSGPGGDELRIIQPGPSPSPSDVTCRQCPMRVTSAVDPQTGQPQSISIIGNKVGPCLLQHKTISMPNT
uniref:Uncharacterized protein n=1 Tax=Tetranychus urticae TaxID=32264 RepID=T1K6V6_TETUR